MRILHIGIFGTEDPNCGLANAFMNNCNSFKAINSNAPNLEHNIITLIRRWKPELVFMQIQNAGKISVNVIKKLKATGAFIINWNGDVRDATPEWMVELAPYVLSCFSNMRDVNYIRSLGYKAEWLECYVDTDIYNPEGFGNVNNPPVVFMGNNNSNFPLSAFRIEMCKELKKEFKHNFIVIGNGKDADINLNGYQIEEAAIYRTAKIAINVSHYEIEKYTSDRMLRILSMGTPICLAKEYPNMPYSDCIHLRTWKNTEQLKDLIKYYLDPDNELERQTIANNGRELILNNYTYTHFVNNLKSFIC
jgi:hypothetical protein